MFRLHLKLFYKNKVLAAISTVFFAFISLYLIYYAVIPYVMDYGTFQDMFVSPLNNTIALSWFCFIFFLFVSYEYFVQMKRCGVKEIADSTLKSSNRTYQSQFLVMEAMILLLFCGLTGYVLALTALAGSLTAEFAAFILCNLFLNIFLLSNVGLCIGMAVNFSKKRLSAYILLLLFAMLTGPFGEPMYGTITNYTGMNLYKIAYLLSIFPPSDGFVTDYSFVSSVLPYRFFAAFFWILLAVTVIFLSLHTMKKSSVINRVTSAVSFVFAIVCAAGVLLPQSKVIRNSDPAEFNFGDDMYYHENYQGQEVVFPDTAARPFRVLKYDMTFSAFTKLNAEVTMTVDQNDLDIYAFSLYHGYQVHSVTDQEGRDMEFVQEKDYITVKNDGRSVQKITMQYKGQSASLYANAQGLNLPGDFAYYPRAGYQVLYNIKGRCVQSTFAGDDTEFNVSFPYGKEIYSNLAQDGDHQLSGKSNGVTLVSGFYTEKEFEDFTVLIPYLDGYFSNPDYIESVVRELDALCEEADPKWNVKDKKIFILPLPNGSPVTIDFQDHLINTSDWFGLPEDLAIMMLESEAESDAEN